LLVPNLLVALEGDAVDHGIFDYGYDDATAPESGQRSPHSHSNIAQRAVVILRSLRNDSDRFKILLDGD
jgi:hypothetical protein